MQKLDSVFLLVLFISCHVLLARPLAFVLLPKQSGLLSKKLLRAFKCPVTKNQVFASFLSQLQLDCSNQYTRAITLAIFPFFITNCMSHKLFANFFQGLRFELFNTFVSAVSGSPRLPHFQLGVYALLFVFFLSTLLQRLNLKKRVNFLQTCPLFCFVVLLSIICQSI